MPKFLVGTQDGKVRSVHNPPLDFSISGRYAIDVPQDLIVEALTDSVFDLVAEKVKAFKTQRDLPSLNFSVNDELLDTTLVDTSKSSRYFLGAPKKTAIFPSGIITTVPLSIVSATSKIYFHWYGFTLASDPGPQPPDDIPVRPDPPRLLYNFDPSSGSFVEFSTDDFKVEVLDSTGVTVLLTASPDRLTNFSFGPGSVRLRFTNMSAGIRYLSDWILLHDSAP